MQVINWFIDIDWYWQWLIVFALVVIIWYIIGFVYNLIDIFSKRVTQTKRFVTGKTRVGKTSLEVMRARKFYKKYDKLYHKFFEPLYNAYKENGYSELKMPEHFVFGDMTMSVQGKLQQGCKIMNYVSFPQWASCLDHKENLEYLPIGAYFLFDDCQSYIDSRNSYQLCDSISRLLDLHGKAYWNLTFIGPDINAVDKRIRDGVNEIQYVIDRQEIKIPFLNIFLGYRWTSIVYRGQKPYEDFCNSKKPVSIVNWFQKYFLLQKPDIELVHEFYFGNPHDYYDSTLEIAHFLKDVIKYKYNSVYVPTRSRFYVNQFAKNHPLYMPEEYKKYPVSSKEVVKDVKDKKTKKGEVKK